MPNSPDFDQLTSQEMQQVNDACDRFEAAWQAWHPGSAPPSVASALEAFTCSEEAKLIQSALCWALVEVDREARLKRGIFATQWTYEDALPKECHRVLQYINFDIQPDRGNAVSTQTESIRYHVVDKHALGGLGEVFVARDQELGRDVALKKIRSEYADDPEYRNRFLLEAEVTGSLEHPGIVPVYGLGHYDDGRPYYAMRFIKGKSLRDHVDEYHGTSSSDPNSSRTKRDFRSLEFRQLLGRFVDVCNAIEYAHSRGVLHRDLKPSNVMLGEFGETLVVDWGLAKLDAHESGWSSEKGTRIQAGSGSGSTPTQVGTAIGTPAYMSPEQAAGRTAEMGPRSDVYGLGATLYYMLTGQAPFNGNSTDDIIERVQNGNFKPVREVCPQVPKVLQAICHRAMSRHPGERYPSAKAIGNEIERWLADEPVEVFRESIPSRTFRWIRRHKVASTAMTIMALLIPVGVIVWQGITQREQVAASQSQLNVEMLTELIQTTQTEFQGLPGTGKVRQAFLAVALQYLGKVANRYVENERTDKQYVLALLQLAQLAIVIESNDSQVQDSESKADRTINSPVYRAVGFFDRAERIARRLVTTHPGDIEYQQLLSTVLVEFGTIRIMEGRISDAVILFSEGSNRLQAIVNHSSDEYDVVRLSFSYKGLGEASMKNADPVAAIEYLKKSKSVFDLLSDGKRSQPEIQMMIREVMLVLGRGYLEVGKIDEAMIEFESAVRILRALQQEKPTLVSGSELAKALSLVIKVQILRNDFASALTLQREAIQAAESDADIESRYVRREIARGYHGLGDIHLSMGNPDSAADSFLKSLDNYERLAEQDPLNADSQNDLRFSITQLGMCKLTEKPYRLVKDRLIRILDAYEAMSPIERVARNRACVLASLANLADNNEPMGSGIEYRRGAESELRQLLESKYDEFLATELAVVCEKIGLDSLLAGDGETALEMQRRVLDIRQQVAAKTPNAPNAHRSVFASQYNIGVALLLNANYSHASESFRAAVATVDQALERGLAWPSSDVEKNMVALYGLGAESLACTERNQFNKAAELAVEITKLPYADSQCLGIAASVFGRCINAMGHRDSDDEAAVIARQRLITNAIAATREAIAKGADKSLYNDADLKSLQGNPEFEAIFHSSNEMKQ